jgi:uncharacterized protein YkwD
MRKLSALALSASFILALAITESDAGWRCRARRRPRCQPAPMAAQAAPAQAYAVAPSASDPGAFLAWINAVRSRSGLRPVGWDQDMAADAAQNSARGFGHFFMGRARRQNAGVGQLGAVESAWLQSPAHASAILDPSITAVGLAGVGGVWTFAAR